EPAQQAAIFEEFRRGDGAAGQGLGLGLAIADRIAQLLEAALTLRSRVGRGTVFALAVPRVATRAPAATAGKRGIAGTRVLIVDKDPVARQSVRGVLEGWGCEVDAVVDGDAAEQAMAANDASLWLFDYHLDAGDTGTALHARLARRFGVRPALILSGDGSEAVRRAVHEAGLPLLAKPLKPLALKSVLDRLLAARAA